MKKSIISFQKNGRKFNIRRKITEVEKFDTAFHADSNVDKFGRVVHNMRWSETAYVMTRDEYREEMKNVLNMDTTFSGVYSSIVTADPAEIVEFAFDNNINLGESE